MSDKGTAWLGPLMFGLAYQFTNSYRVAILSLATFFIVGLALLFFVNTEKAILEAGRDDGKQLPAAGGQ